MKHLLKRPSPAVVLSALALFVALGGTSLAAAGYIDGSRIKSHSIAEAKLTAKAIKALRGQRGAAGTTGAPGPQGAAGPQGAKGSTGGIGPSDAYAVNASGDIPLGSGFKTLASLTLAAGSYVVMAKTTLYMPTKMGTGCNLTDSVAGIIDRNSESPVLYDTPSLLSPLKTNGSTVTIECGSNELDAEAMYTRLVAIKVGTVTGS